MPQQKTPADDNPDRFGVAEGAQKMALRMTIQALVEHASMTDPGLRDRILATAEAYLIRLGPQSDLERDFAEKARDNVAALLQPPAE